jgi:glycosyltransferase
MKVTIITAVYNNARSLQRTIDSVHNQSYQDIEHIIIDGNSTDGSSEIAMKNISQKCRVISENDLGYYDALNKGIGLAEGCVIGILNADDLFSTQDVISNVVSNFVKNMDLDCVYGDLNYVSRKGGRQIIIRKWISGDFTEKKLKYGWMPPHPTIFMKKKSYEKVGGFSLRFRISSDYEFILRAFKTKGFKSKYVPLLMVDMQIGGASNGSLKNILIKMMEDFVIMKDNQMPAMTALFFKNALKLRQLRYF